MGVGWIDDIYVNTDHDWYISSVDDRNNGKLTHNQETIELDGGQVHAIKGDTHYHAEWCGIPWYYQGKHYKTFSKDNVKTVQYYTTEVEGGNYILYIDKDSGREIARQSVPDDGDYHCKLRFEADGIYIDVVNDPKFQPQYYFLQNGDWIPTAIETIAKLLLAAAA